MTNQSTNSNDGNGQKVFDLEERTARFGEAVIGFCKKSPLGPVTNPIVTQLIKAGTSVGANYGEANDAESKKDFRHKIGICRKDSKESKHFVRMLVAAAPALRDEGAVIWQEAKELNLIFGAILRGKRAVTAEGD
jgi:four helix bundle protein